MGTRTLFSDIDLAINSGDRIGLVGHNGSGKSTLFSILSGTLEPDTGDISRNHDLQLEIVEQFIGDDLLALTLLGALLQKLPAEEAVSGRYRAEQLLTDLGFDPAEYDFLVNDLSGGQQNRLMFARAIITGPNLILFDEPTNHLDLRTVLIFEGYLKTTRSAFLIISHDRAFLDRVTNRTVFLRDERLYNFDLPYTSAREALEEQDLAAAATREQEEKDIRRLEASAKRLATWGRVYDNEKLARKAKSMEKRIDRMKDEKTFVSRGSGLNLTVDVGGAQADRMLAIEGCDIHAPDRSTLFHIEDMIIRPCERVALLGHNGVGKTTLITRIMDLYAGEPAGDEIRFNPQCQIGYYDQELNRLNPALSMLENLRENCAGAGNRIKTALIRAGFPYTDIDKKVEILSGGEKARLMFLIIELNQPNFLILDEPTNHIDIQGKEELEAQILDSKATVIITSHDRRFVDNIANRYLLIHSGQLREIHRPEEFYQMDRADRPLVAHENVVEKTELSEEETLARIIELEELITADEARKPKFQKLKLQAAWRNELSELKELLL